MVMGLIMRNLKICIILLCMFSQYVNAEEACSISYLVNNEMPSIPVKFEN